MNRASRVGALGALGVLGVIPALVFGCGGGNSSPAIDADGADAGADLGGVVDTDSDAANPGDGSMPAPCANELPFESVCSGYCSNLGAACTGSNSQFSSNADCLAACNAPTWSCGAPSDTTGNTVFCRVRHAMSATTAPDIECPQAGPNSASCI